MLCDRTFIYATIKQYSTRLKINLYKLQYKNKNHSSLHSKRPKKLPDLSVYCTLCCCIIRKGVLSPSSTFVPKSESFKNLVLTALRSIENNYISRNCLAKLKKWWGLIKQIEKKASHPGVGVLPPPHQVGFLHHFGLKMGINFAPFGLESGMVFEGTI